MTRSVVALVLGASGVALLVAAALALLRLRTPLDRLHAAAVATSAGVPLVAVALAVHDGTLHGVAKLLLTGALVAATGPALSTATARAVVARERGTGGR